MTRQACLAIVAFAVVAAISTPLPAQAPDCTGISDVSNFDGPTVSDMAGNLTTVRLISAGLTRPLYVTQPPGDLDRLFIVLQDGTIRIFRNGALVGTPFLDISGLVRSPIDGGHNEEGLLGLAFHPDYATNGWFWVFHSNGASNNVVARYTRDSGNPDLADPTTRLEFLTIPHPTNGNHNGGMIAFREQDGHLYIGTGDGGGACDTPNNAQNLNSLLGKLLRLNVDTFPYTTAGNPFDGATPGLSEIWAFGLRNPWRWSFDRITQSLYIGDVGQNAWEEIDCTRAQSGGGENYQWDVYEGNHCPACGHLATECGPLGGEGAIHEYVSPGRSVNGGYVYRGCRMGDLAGTYFFSDHISSVITSFRTDASCGFSSLIERAADLDPDGAGGAVISQMTSFGEDNRGEIYIVDRGSEIYKIVPQLNIMEVSGLNATQFTMGPAGGDWTWENLQATSSHPITVYKVYRSEGNPLGPFDCVHQSPTNSWVGGDPDTPSEGEVYYYLVTARNAAGEETRPGYQSDGTPRTVNTASVCPAL